MKEQFLRHVGKSALFTHEDKILLAVSGGLDSMAMLNLFSECGFTIGVAHVNFQLRGSESDGDAQLVEEVCRNKNIPCFTTRVDTKEYAGQHGLSTQIAARELRYNWFREIMAKESYTHLATAHHRNDNLETILLNLARGTELKPIPERNENIVRPLLPFSREMIEAYAKENGLAWRDDSSNLTDLYPRNFIRHHIVPRLKELNGSIEDSFERTLAHLKLSRELANRSIVQLKQEAVRQESQQVLITKRFVTLTSQPAVLLWELIKSYDFNLTQCQDVVGVISGEPGKIFLSPGYKLLVDRDDLIITKNEKLWETTTISEHKEEAVLGGWMLSLETPFSIEIENDSFVAWLDKDKVKFPPYVAYLASR